MKHRTRIFAIIATSLGVASHGQLPAAAATPPLEVTSTEAAPPALLVAPTDEASLVALMNRAGCLFAAPAAKALACIEAPVDMGFTTIKLLGLDIKGTVVQSFVLYSEGNTGFDDEALRLDAFRNANAWLATSGFQAGVLEVNLEADKPTLSGGRVTVKSAGAEYQGLLPSIETATKPSGYKGKLAKCAEWSVEAAWAFPGAGLVGVRISRRDHFQYKHRKKACYMKHEQIDDESYPGEERLLVLTRE